jgi:hypothetical protein
MAVALKQQAFANASEVAKFAAAPANNVTAVLSIVFDTSSGKYILFWT